MNKQVCVIGLGRFGSTVARELYQAGHDVLAVDANESTIQDMLGSVTYAVRADATNESVLRELGVADFDVAIVALGNDNIQSSILVTVILKSLDIPFIVARAANELHGTTLDRRRQGRLSRDGERPAGGPPRFQRRRRRFHGNRPRLRHRQDPSS